MSPLKFSEIGKKFATSEKIYFDGKMADYMIKGGGFPRLTGSGLLWQGLKSSATRIILLKVFWRIVGGRYPFENPRYPQRI